MTVASEHLVLRSAPTADALIQSWNQAIDGLLREDPTKSDEWIARKVVHRVSGLTRLMPRQVAERRLVLAGAIPKVDHAGLIRILSLHAWHLGFDAAPERHIPLGGRRFVVPDLVVALRGQPIRWIIEVKTSLSTRADISTAARQARRYVEALNAPAIVTSYAPPAVDHVGDVLFMKASAVRLLLAEDMRAQEVAA